MSGWIERSLGYWFLAVCHLACRLLRGQTFHCLTLDCSCVTFNAHPPSCVDSEKEMLKNEIHSLHDVKGKLKERIAYLEENGKKMREYYEKKLTEAANEEESVPYGQQKRFTRMEMARMVQEKNKYKEQLMELQEELRLRHAASVQQRLPGTPDRRGRSSLWKLYVHYTLCLVSSQGSLGGGVQRTRKRDRNGREESG